MTAAELVLVQPGGVPKTSSGKLRRQACKQAYLDGVLSELARFGDGKATKALTSREQRNEWSHADSEEENGITAEPEFQLLREALSVVPRAQRAPLIVRFLRAKIARLLKIWESTVSIESPLRGSGLDSLKAVELKHAVDELLGIETPLTLFL
ncbi:MAG: non-ribosomal peptide synthetase, partial [Methylococcales bacterium]